MYPDVFVIGCSGCGCKFLIDRSKCTMNIENLSSECKKFCSLVFYLPFTFLELICSFFTADISFHSKAAIAVF